MRRDNERTMLGAMSKYRWRTRLRTFLPWILTPLIPKGSNDCGDHEWHRSDATTWRCVHCKAGVTHEEPWGPIESVHLKLAAAESTLHVGKYRDLKEAEVIRAEQLLCDAHAQLDSLMSNSPDEPGVKAALEAELAALRT